MRAPNCEKIKTFLQTLLFLISPLMIIGCLGIVLALVTAYGEHRGMVQRMRASGLEVEATVDSAAAEHGWVFVSYVDGEGNARSGVMETRYYPAEVLESVEPDQVLAIRYLPFSEKDSDRVVLAQRFEDVERYRGYLSPELLIALAVCWLGVILYPHWLYAGLADTGDVFEGTGSPEGRTS